MAWACSAPEARNRAARAVGQQTTLPNGAGPPPRQASARESATVHARRCPGPAGAHPFYEHARVSRPWRRAKPTSGAVVRISAPLLFTGTAALRAASLQAPGDSVPAVHLLSVPARSRTPHSLFAAKRVWEARGEGPHLTLGQPGRPGIAPGPRTRSCGAVSALLSAQRPRYAARGCACFFSTAPAGGVPVCRYFHSSIRSFRASATIPIFRCRVLPDAYRSRYHLLRSLSGW